MRRSNYVYELYGLVYSTTCLTNRFVSSSKVSLPPKHSVNAVCRANSRPRFPAADQTLRITCSHVLGRLCLPRGLKRKDSDRV